MKHITRAGTLLDMVSAANSYSIFATFRGWRFPSYSGFLVLSLILSACGGGATDSGSPSSGTSVATSAEASASFYEPTFQTTTSSTSITSSTSTSTSTSSTASTTTTTVPVSSNGLPAAQTCGLDNFQQELISRINQIRASTRTCGSLTYAAAPPLAWNSKLFDAAAGHSADMAAKNYFSHTSQDGSTFSQRITNAGYNWSATGENIAAGQTTVAQVMDAWVKSPGHCANLMNKTFTEVGVSCVRSDTSTYKYYWTMNLARPN